MGAAEKVLAVMEARGDAGGVSTWGLAVQRLEHNIDPGSLGRGQHCDFNKFKLVLE